MSEVNLVLNVGSPSIKFSAFATARATRCARSTAWSARTCPRWLASTPHSIGVLPDFDSKAAAGRTIVAHFGSGASMCVTVQLFKETSMARLFLGNIEAGTSDDEIKAFLVKYGFPEFDKIEHVPGDGSRPAAMLTFQDVQPEGLRKQKERIHDMYWKKGRITAQIMSDDFA